MDVTLALAADYANITADGKLNILGVFTAVNAPRFPFVLPQMYLVLSYETSAAELTRDVPVQVALLDSENNEVMALSGTISAQGALHPDGQVMLNQLVSLAGLMFSRPGAHQFVVSVDGELKRTITLHVNERPEGDHDVG
jgi:hypothetical protein